MSDRRCRICGREQELVKRGAGLRDEHKCEPAGCRVAATTHTLADGSPCPDPRHKENKEKTPCTSS